MDNIELIFEPVKAKSLPDYCMFAKSKRKNARVYFLFGKEKVKGGGVKLAVSDRDVPGKRLSIWLLKGDTELFVVSAKF